MRELSAEGEGEGISSSRHKMDPSSSSSLRGPKNLSRKSSPLLTGQEGPSQDTLNPGTELTNVSVRVRLQILISYSKDYSVSKN